MPLAYTREHPSSLVWVLSRMTGLPSELLYGVARAPWLGIRAGRVVGLAPDRVVLRAFSDALRVQVSLTETVSRSKMMAHLKARLADGKKTGVRLREGWVLLTPGPKLVGAGGEEVPNSLEEALFWGKGPHRAQALSLRLRVDWPPLEPLARRGVSEAARHIFFRGIKEIKRELRLGRVEGEGEPRVAWTRRALARCVEVLGEDPREILALAERWEAWDGDPGSLGELIDAEAGVMSRLL